MPLRPVRRPKPLSSRTETLNLPDVYAVVSRYLAAPAPFDDYLRQCDVAAVETRQKIEEFQGSQSNLCATLLARAKVGEDERAQASQ